MITISYFKDFIIKPVFNFKISFLWLSLETLLACLPVGTVFASQKSRIEGIKERELAT